MPAIQDEIWAAAWVACLKKAGTAESSPLWTKNDLPSSQVVVEDEMVEEEDSLDRELNAQVSGQPGVVADQVDKVTNLGQKEASGGPNEESTVVEDTSAQASPPAIQDLTIEE